MPGMKRYREFVHKLELAAYADGYEDPMDMVLERIGNGEGLRAIATDIGGMSRFTLWKWICAEDDKQQGIYGARHLRYLDARRVGASALVEEAQEILDKADTSNTAAVASARNRAAFRQWQAAMADKKEFTRDLGRTQVNVNIGSLHLDTLRKLGGPQAFKREVLPVAEQPEPEPLALTDGSEDT